jgi:hypothetical protein
MIPSYVALLQLGFNGSGKFHQCTIVVGGDAAGHQVQYCAGSQPYPRALCCGWGGKVISQFPRPVFIDALSD